jgi:hypothetical protein
VARQNLGRGGWLEPLCGILVHLSKPDDGWAEISYRQLLCGFIVHLYKFTPKWKNGYHINNYNSVLFAGCDIDVLSTQPNGEAISNNQHV